MALASNKEKEIEALWSYSCQQQMRSGDMKKIEAQVSVLPVFAPSRNYYRQKRNYVTLWVADQFEQISCVYMVFSLLTAHWSNECNFNLLLCQILISLIIIWNFRDQEVQAWRAVRTTTAFSLEISKAIIRLILVWCRKSSQVWTCIHADRGRYVRSRILR